MMKTDKNGAHSEQIIIFESISCFVSYAILRYHLWKGRRIICFEITKRFEQKKPVIFALQSGRIKKVIWTDIDYADRAALDNEVLNITEQMFDTFFAHSWQIIMLRNLVHSKDTDFAFKKSLGMHVYHVLRLFLLSDFTLKKTSTHVALRLYPATNFPYAIYKKMQQLLPKKVPKDNISTEWIFVLWVDAFWQKFIWFLITLAFPVYILVRVFYSKYYMMRKNPYGPLKSSSYNVGIRIFDNDIGFYQEHKSIDFLLKRKNLSKEQTIFCIETKMHDHYRDDLKTRRYNVIEIPQCHCFLTFPIAFRYICKFPSWIASILYSVIEPAWITAMAIESRNTVFLWSVFLNRYSIDHYITYNDVLPKHVPRNCVLRNHGTLSWYYVHSCNTTNYFTPPGKEDFKNLYFSFISYDRFVTWSDATKNYYEMHPNSVRKFENIGCLWSEHIREFRNHGLSDPNLKQWIIRQREINPNIRIISVFDTTSGPEYPLQAADIIAFIEGIYNLMENSPDIAVIFKTKLFTQYSMQDNPRLKGLSLDKYQRIESATEKSYEPLHNHPRIYLMSEIHSEPSEAIAASDLVISACFSSPTIEALGSRTKAIYFDAGERFRGYYYDKFPHMVAHNYDELGRYVAFWLTKISEKEFNDYIGKWIIPEIDAFADGKAITRFIDLLTSPKEID